jgi:hypothetical protein
LWYFLSYFDGSLAVTCRSFHTIDAHAYYAFIHQFNAFGVEKRMHRRYRENIFTLVEIANPLIPSLDCIGFFFPPSSKLTKKSRRLGSTIGVLALRLTWGTNRHQVYGS